MLKSNGDIFQDNKQVGKCNRMKYVDLENDYCPQGKGITLYICLRCKYFENIE